MRAAEELAYRPDQRARLLGRNRSRLVGVAFGLHDEFHAEVVEQLYQAVDGTGYELALGAVAPTRAENRAEYIAAERRRSHKARRACETSRAATQLTPRSHPPDREPPPF